MPITRQNRKQTQSAIIPALFLVLLYFLFHFFIVSTFLSTDALYMAEESWRMETAHGLLIGALSPRVYTDYEGGSLIASLFLVPFLALGGYSFATMKIAGVALAALAYFFFVLLVYKTRPRSEARFASLLFFFPFPHFYWHSMYVMGDHRQIPLVSFILFLTLLSLIKEDQPSKRAFLFFGLAAGFAMFVCYGAAYSVLLGLWLLWLHRDVFRPLTRYQLAVRLSLIVCGILLWIWLLSKVVLKLGLSKLTLTERLFLNTFTGDELALTWSRFIDAVFVILPISFFPSISYPVNQAVMIVCGSVIALAAAIVLFRDRRLLRSWFSGTVPFVKYNPTFSELPLPANLPLVSVVFSIGFLIVYSVSRFQSTPLEYVEQLHPFLLIILASLPGKLPVRWRKWGYVPGVILLSASLIGNFIYLDKDRLSAQDEGFLELAHYDEYPLNMGQIFSREENAAEEALTKCSTFSNLTDRGMCLQGVKDDRLKTTSKSSLDPSPSFSIVEREIDDFGYVCFETRKGINDFVKVGPALLLREIKRQKLKTVSPPFVVLRGIELNKEMEIKVRTREQAIRTSLPDVRNPLKYKTWQGGPVLSFDIQADSFYESTYLAWQEGQRFLIDRGYQDLGIILLWLPEKNEDHLKVPPSTHLNVWIPFQRNTESDNKY